MKKINYKVIQKRISRALMAFAMVGLVICIVSCVDDDDNGDGATTPNSANTDPANPDPANPDPANTDPANTDPDNDKAIGDALGEIKNISGISAIGIDIDTVFVSGNTDAQNASALWTATLNAASSKGVALTEDEKKLGSGKEITSGATFETNGTNDAVLTKDIVVNIKAVIEKIIREPSTNLVEYELGEFTTTVEAGAIPKVDATNDLEPEVNATVEKLKTVVPLNLITNGVSALTDTLSVGKATGSAAGAVIVVPGGKINLVKVNNDDSAVTGTSLEIKAGKLEIIFDTDKDADPGESHFKISYTADDTSDWTKAASMVEKVLKIKRVSPIELKLGIFTTTVETGAITQVDATNDLEPEVNEAVQKLKTVVPVKTLINEVSNLSPYLNVVQVTGKEIGITGGKINLVEVRNDNDAVTGTSLEIKAGKLEIIFDTNKDADPGESHYKISYSPDNPADSTKPVSMEEKILIIKRVPQIEYQLGRFTTIVEDGDDKDVASANTLNPKIKVGAKEVKILVDFEKTIMKGKCYGTIPYPKLTHEDEEVFMKINEEIKDFVEIYIICNKGERSNYSVTYEVPESFSSEFFSLIWRTNLDDKGWRIDSLSFNIESGDLLMPDEDVFNALSDNMLHEIVKLSKGHLAKNINWEQFIEKIEKRDVQLYIANKKWHIVFNAIPNHNELVDVELPNYFLKGTDVKRTR